MREIRLGNQNQQRFLLFSFCGISRNSQQRLDFIFELRNIRLAQMSRRNSAIAINEEINR